MKFLTVSRGALVLAGSALLAACSGTYGDRKLGDIFGQGCPEEEVCSQQTPNGLIFSMDEIPGGIFGGGVYPVVVGGTATIRINQDISFDAVSADPSILEVTKVAPPTIQVKAQAAGDALLRVREKGTSLLLDRTTLKAQAPASVALRPPFFAPGLKLVDPGKPWAYLRGAPADVTVAVLGSKGERLVDGSMAITRQGVSLNSTSCCTFSFTPETAGTFDFEVLTGGQSFPLSALIADTIDDITRAMLEPLPALQVQEGKSTEECFVARSGGTPVLGANAKFSASGSPTIAEFTLGPGFPCIQILGAALGAGTLHVEMAGIARDFQVEVSPKTTP